MKKLIFLFVLFIGFSSCDETDVINPDGEILSASVMDISYDSKTENEISRSSNCFLNSNFTALLYTTSGVRILPANVQPNTNYVVRVRITGSYVCCQNPAYCIASPFGFTVTSGNPKDSVNGNVDFTIRTNSVLIPGSGIIGVVQAIGCNGSPGCNDPGASAVKLIS